MKRTLQTLTLTVAAGAMVVGCQSKPHSDYASEGKTAATAQASTSSHQEASAPTTAPTVQHHGGVVEITGSAPIAVSNFTPKAPAAASSHTQTARTQAQSGASQINTKINEVQSQTKRATSTRVDATGLAANTVTHKPSPYGKPGFIVTEEEGLIWVLKPGQTKSDKAVSLIGKAPGGKTVRALDRETAAEYIATRPGFKTEIEDGRLWVFKPGQEKSDKHVTYVGSGPMGMTLKAVDRDTAIEYMGAKPGFNTMVKDGRFWILEYGDKPKDKHVTFVAAGPVKMTVKVNDRDLALAYFAAAEGFDTEIEDERIWVLAPGEEKSDKHITRINAGPRGMTLKGVSADTLNRYTIATNQR